MPSAEDITKLLQVLGLFADKHPLLCFWTLTMLGLPPLLKYIVELRKMISVEREVKDDKPD